MTVNVTMNYAENCQSVLHNSGTVYAQVVAESEVWQHQQIQLVMHPSEVLCHSYLCHHADMNHVIVIYGLHLSGHAVLDTEQNHYHHGTG